MNYQMKRNARTILMWVLIVFGGWSGYRLFSEGAFSAMPRAMARVYGGFPIVGKPIKQWAYGKKYYRSSRKAYRRGRKGYSRRGYRGSRRGRRR